jgi:hypothetical protein
MRGSSAKVAAEIKESGITLPSFGRMVKGASKLEKSCFTRSSMPLKALITQTIAAVMNATTSIEIMEMALMIPRDLAENKWRRAMKNGTFNAMELVSF